jgi:peroxiredoxin
MHHHPYDLTVLPEGLPVPGDDGAADHLPHAALPRLAFVSTQGGVVDLAEQARGGLVLYIYPRTGRPSEAPPTGWDETPGARGCTPQSCAFRDSYDEFSALGVQVAGLSAQTHEDQAEAAARLRLPFPLLADPELTLASALRLPTFEIAGMRLYKRMTLIAFAGRIVKVFYPVFPPDENAAEVRGWLRRHCGTGSASR